MAELPGVTALRLICRFAVANNWLRVDPTLSIKPIRAKSGGFATWSEDDIGQFEKYWQKGTRQRLAFALLLYTGQRRGDVVCMGRQHVSDGCIHVVQSKTGAKLKIPLHPRLKAEIKNTPNGNMAFLITEFGKPFTAAGFGNWFREACDKAGLKQRSAHGLRKAAARRLAEEGCSVHEIAAITGHRTLQEVARYTVAADQERLARSAVGKMTPRGRKANK